MHPEASDKVKGDVQKIKKYALIKLPLVDRLLTRAKQMVFDVDKVQMKFLHLLSTEASHHITLHCKNEPSNGFGSTSSAPREDTNPRFSGWNRQTFQKDTLLEPHVLQDDCKVCR